MCNITYHQDPRHNIRLILRLAQILLDLAYLHLFPLGAPFDTLQSLARLFRKLE